MRPPPQSIVPRAGMLVTGFFERGSEYRTTRPQGTDDWLLIYTVRGAGVFKSDATTVRADPGDWILIRPRTSHSYAAAAPPGLWVLTWAHFIPRPHWLPWLDWPSLSPGMQRLQPRGVEAAEIGRRIQQCHQLATGARPRRESLAMNALEEVLLHLDEANPRTHSLQTDERIASAMQIMCGRLSEPLSVEQLADEVALSPSRFAHLFREQVGTSPQQYLSRQRLDRAAQLLDRTRLPLKQIAREVGLESPFYFSLWFKKLVGMSPSAYRDRPNRNVPLTGGAQAYATDPRP